MRRRAFALALLLALGLLLAAAGCGGTSKNVLAPNLPPETTVYVQGPVDTVNHRVHIYWFGSDPDGYVVAYLMRFVPPQAPDTLWDTVYCALPGRCTDSVFTIITGDSTLVHTRFEIRAMDDKGQIDPTPATQLFLLSNRAPTVTIKDPYVLAATGDTTYASVTAMWDVTDLDGGGPGLRYRIWLDGNQAGYDSTTEKSFTVPSHRFLRNGTYPSGPRTLYIQAVDDGGSAGPPASMTWYVRAPAATLTPDLRGEALLIDEVPSDGGNNFTYDAFYLAALTESLTAARFSVLRPQFNPRIFRSPRDFAQTLRQFKCVIWYRGQETSISTLLSTYQDSLEAWLDTGGNLYADGLYLIQGLNTPGALTADFAARRLHTAGMYNNLNSSIADSTAGWGNRTNTRFRSSIYGDIMVATIQAPSIPGAGQTPGIRCFIPAVDTASVALWALDSLLTPPNDNFDAPVGISAAQPGGGRVVFISMPLRLGQPAPAGRLYRRMLYGFNATPGLIKLR